MAYLLSTRAELDLEEIWLYTRSTWSLAQADKYLSDLLTAMHELGDGIRPSKRWERRGDVFRATMGRHDIYFLARGYGDILIIRVLHQAMDPSRHL